MAQIRNLVVNGSNLLKWVWTGLMGLEMGLGNGLGYLSSGNPIKKEKRETERGKDAKIESQREKERERKKETEKE